MGSPLFFGQNVAATGTLPIGDLIANETFETPTTGFVLPSWNTVIGTGSTVNPVANTSPSPAGGTQYLDIIGIGDVAYAYKDFSASGEVYIRMLVRWTSGSSRVCYLRDIGNNAVMFVIISALGLPTIFDAGNNSSVDWTSSLTTNVWYYMWLHWKHGAGQTVQIAVSTTSTRPAYVSQTGGNSSTDATRLVVGSSNGETSINDFDNVNAGTTAL